MFFAPPGSVLAAQSRLRLVVVAATSLIAVLLIALAGVPYWLARRLDEERAKLIVASAGAKVLRQHAAAVTSELAAAVSTAAEVRDRLSGFRVAAGGNTTDDPAVDAVQQPNPGGRLS